MGNISLGCKKSTQRKNTSDSNVKLLADHNFYHISKKKHQNECFQLDNQVYGETCENTNINNNNNNNNNINNRINFIVNSRPYEQTDVFKYNSKYRRGFNSSSNSLVSLNESSPSPNEELNYTNSENNLIRSNPDFNEMIGRKSQLCVASPIMLVSPAASTTLNRKAEYVADLNQSGVKKELGSYSNNASLNLSIHTAEEFSLEMLSWLKNETNLHKKIKNDENLEKVDNATLV